jgi:hypothetical protein
MVALFIPFHTIGDEIAYEPLYADPSPKEKHWNVKINIPINVMCFFIT